MPGIISTRTRAPRRVLVPIRSATSRTGRSSAGGGESLTWGGPPGGYAGSGPVPTVVRIPRLHHAPGPASGETAQRDEPADDAPVAVELHGVHPDAAEPIS